MICPLYSSVTERKSKRRAPGELRHVAGIVCIARGGFIVAGDFSSFCPRLLTIVICVVLDVQYSNMRFRFFCVCGETGDILVCLSTSSAVKAQNDAAVFACREYETPGARGASLRTPTAEALLRSTFCVGFSLACRVPVALHVLEIKTTINEEQEETSPQKRYSSLV